MGTPKDTRKRGPCPCKARGFVLAFPGANSLTSLSNSLKSRKKRKEKGPRCQGWEAPSLAVGNPNASETHTRCCFRSSEAERRQRCPQPPARFLGAVPSHPGTSRSPRLAYSSAVERSVPQTLPCSWDRRNPLVSWG